MNGKGAGWGDVSVKRGEREGRRAAVKVRLKLDESDD